MNLVVDANILFAALIKISKTSDLMVDNSLNLVSVEFIFEEFEKYKDLIRKKTTRTEEEFEMFMGIIQKRVKLIPFEKFKSFMNETETFSPDPKDTEYLALALKLNCALWSNDKKLKTQDKVKVYSTEDLMNELKK